MNYLTPYALREMAPATQKLPAKSKSGEALIDTSAFLRHIAQEGYKPIFAAQGKAHADVDSPERGRHFVVVSNADYMAYGILNSHTVYRRAWLAAGFMASGAFLFGAVVPLPRWRGFQGPLEELIGYQQGLKAAQDTLHRWQPSDSQCRWMAKCFADTAYLPGHKPASSKAFDIPHAARVSGWASLGEMMGLVMAGGLDPVLQKGLPRRRRVKPIKGPDALMHAANAAFRVGLDAIRKYKLADTALNFPSYKRT